MRPSLLPNLLEGAIRSLNYGQSHVEIFEVGNVFSNNCEQIFNVAGLRAGAAHDRNWCQPARNVDVFDIKGDVLTILEYFGIWEKDLVLKQEAPSYYHPSRSGSLYFGKGKIGYFGELHPKINKLFDIRATTVCFELLPFDVGHSGDDTHSIPKVFPKIVRDFAFIFNEMSTIGNILNAIYKLDPKIKKVDIFDCFSLGGSKKSVGITATLEAADRTLTDEEAQVVSEKIIRYVGSVGGELRSK
jgi:phenylalanyl-tRNA synthetase beta chain